VQVQLLALNDFHGNLEPPSGSTGAIDGTPAGGVERLATLLADLSAENGTSNTITVAAGDLIGVSPLLSAPSTTSRPSRPSARHPGARRHRAHRRSAGRRRRHLPHHPDSFLADGGDGFGVLRSGSNRAVSGLVVDTFAQYLSANRPISAPATERIRTAGSAPDVSSRPSRYSLRAQNERKRDLRNKVSQAPLSSPPRRGGAYAANDRRSPREGS
jgi:hypothetical protein